MRNRCSRQAFLWLSSLLTVALCACGPAQKPEDTDSGGDHIPDGKVFSLQTLPAGAASATALVEQEETAPFLRHVVHLSERYEVCLDRQSFTDQELTTVQALISKDGPDPRDVGLEKVVNWALGTVNRFQVGAPSASSRIEIDLVWPEGQRCDFLVMRASAGAFPFDQELMRGQDRAYFEVNQLRDQNGSGNSIPVAYLRQDYGGLHLDLGLATQFMVGQFLGLGESGVSGSNLNVATSATTVAAATVVKANRSHGWMVQDDYGALSLNDDTQILYGFALVYRDVLRPNDLESLQFYQDEIGFGEGPQDPDLIMPAVTAPRAFLPQLGNAYLNGVRRLGSDDVTICAQNLSGVPISAQQLNAYFSFISPAAAGSVVNLLNQRDAGIAPHAVVAAPGQGCELVVLLKNDHQYPFAGAEMNGLYAHEGSLRTQTGAASTLPVIYLDATGLDLDPASQGSDAKPLVLVLQHEFAHYLGMKHSTSSHSILSPAGYHRNWDLAGGDGLIFDEYVKVWRRYH